MGNSKNTGKFAYAAKGIIYAAKTQRNMGFHCVAAFMAIVLSWALGIDVLEFMWVILAITMVFMAELFNTAIEVVVDLISPQHHPLAGIAKDVAAGAVLITALHAVVVAFFVFGSYLFNTLRS